MRFNDLEIREYKIEEIRTLADNHPLILYGAGKEGHLILKLFEENLSIPVECFCDQSHDKQKCLVMGKSVYSLQDVLYKYPDAVFIICVRAEDSQQEIEKMFINHNAKNRIYTMWDIYYGSEGNTEKRRLYCAACHETRMSTYFEKAETEASQNVFWGENSEFNRMFRLLDLDETVELACGRGRHVPHYINQAGHIILVDILDSNIDYCKERFKNQDKISYYVNNGYDLKQIVDSSCTALFTYDSMVHFESIDIYYYLLETSRILVKGGRALFHHSNNHKDYQASFQNAVHGRNYMSASLFAHFADRAGLKVLQQITIDWGKERNLDAITLVEK